MINVLSPKNKMIIRCVLSFSAIAFITSCASNKALLRGDYEEVSPSMIFKAGEAEKPENLDAIRQLLSQRVTEQSSMIPEDLTTEAVIALGKIGGLQDTELLTKLLKNDPSVDVRYFAVNSLHQISPEYFQKISSEILASEQSQLVIDQILKLLSQSS